MNKFPRGSLYQGHQIIACPSLYSCAECNGRLVYSFLDADTDTLRCSNNPEHTGLRDQKEINQERNQERINQINESAQRLKELSAADPIVKAMMDAVYKVRLSALFGDE